MNKRLTTILSLLVLFSMVLSACTAATTQAPPAATSAPAATDTAVPQPTNTAPPAATAAPTDTPAPTTPPKSTRTGGWLDQVVFTAIADAPSAVAQLQAGAIDLYPVSATDANAFKTVQGDKNLAYSNVYGSNDQLLFNTVPCTDKNILNPFTSMKIREAMNWVIDRNYVAQEIGGGLAVPKYTALDTAFPDAARFAGELGAIATKYAYNMDKAQKVVDSEMTAMGATKDANGKYQYKGKPVTVIGLIRTEDNRKQVGEYFANQLEKLGFTVTRDEKVRKEASPIWQGDPAPCKFNYYTAGWINTAIIRDEGLNFAEFNSGLVQNIPLFLKFTPSKELEAAENALLNNTFKSMDERAQLFKTALDLSMTESWWGVWVIDNLAYEPYSAKVSVASDLAAGISNRLLGYTLRLKDQEGGSMKIAQSGIVVQAWNPVNGSNWTDDHTVQVMTSDFGVVADPYTGLYLPKMVQKADIIAKTGLPITKTLDWVTLKFQDNIAVPDDAWADWDATKQTFITAADRAKADPKFKQTANVQSTVTFSPDLFKTKWHDGSTFSVADVVMGMILTFDPGKKDSKIFDEGFATTVDTLLTHFKGVKIVSTDPLTITTWDDQYALDAEGIIGSYTTGDWYPTDSYTYGTAAWHNQYPMIQAEIDGKMAMSLDKSTAKKVDESSLISGPTLAIQSTYLDKDATSGEIPYAPTLGKYVTADDAKARYANLQAFYKAHNNMWIGTGPYFVDKVDTTAGSITLTRFKDYMFPSDQFSGFSVPKIATASVDGPTQVKQGDDAPFTISVKFGDQPYASKDLDTVAYTVFAADGSIAAQGTATLASEGSYTVDLTKDVTAKLPAGTATLSVAVSSKVVSLPAFATYQFVVTQ